MSHVREGHWVAIATCIILCLAISAPAVSLAQGQGIGGGQGGGRGGGKKASENAGNNLSFPVLWAEGVVKTLRGTAGVELFDGVWWYWWGTDADDEPLSCAPDTENVNYCEDGDDNPETLPSELPGPGAVKVYLQQDADNEWQAQSADASFAPVDVDWIDWGDNLESVDWYTKSQVRTEVVLIEELAAPMIEYDMRHLSGWGIDEMHGTTGVVLPGVEATVYSPCARLTIQKLLVERTDPALASLVWVPEEGWYAPSLVNEPIFNMAVYNAGDGPGYYNAEINVKGKIIYGYTWNVRRLNDGAGDYRITFSFDEVCGGAALNTYFTQGITQIVVPIEEDIVVLESEPAGGAVGVIDFANNLTYMDVRILDRGGGGGRGKK